MICADSSQALDEPHRIRYLRTIRATLCLIAVLVVTRSGTAEAQRPTGAPTVLVSRPIASPPDSTPVVRETLARETPRAIEGLQRHLPAVILADHYLVVASTTWSHDWAIRPDSAEPDLVRCSVTLGVPRDTMRAFLDEEPWRAFDEEVVGSPYVLFQAMPNDIPTAACARPRLHDPRYLQRGLMLTTASLLDTTTNVSDVDVFADDGFRTPTIYGRVPVAATEWFRSPDTPLARPPVVRQVRVYLPMEALDPHGGRFPTVVLRVWNAYLKVMTIPVPGPLSSQLWRELVPWRLERLRGAMSSGTSNVPGIPAPNDRTLREAADRYRRGEVIDAAEQAAAWRALDWASTPSTDSTRASLRRDRLIADVMIGGALAAAGDTVAATPFADDALATAPCLVPSIPATATYALMLAKRRPKFRCSGLPLSTVVRRGLVFPGGGHAIAGDKGLAVAATAAVGVTLGGAAVATLVASQRYDQYKTATTVESARQRYSGASAMRDLGIGLVVGSAVVWLADVGYAVIREKHRTARVRAEASFGRQACSGDAAGGCSR